jgi:hypothetical protein
MYREVGCARRGAGSGRQSSDLREASRWATNSLADGTLSHRGPDLGPQFPVAQVCGVSHLRAWNGDIRGY